MKLLIDTNIVLDVLLKREEFYKAAFEILKRANSSDYIAMYLLLLSQIFFTSASNILKTTAP